MNQNTEKIAESDSVDVEKSNLSVSTQLWQLQNLPLTNNVRPSSGNLIVQFDYTIGNFLFPGGHFSVKLYDSMFRIRQENKNYKINYKYISRLFLLPSPDERYMKFIIVLTRPIRYDQQLSHMLIWQINKEISVLELQLDHVALSTVYQDKLHPVMKGRLCDSIAKIFKVITDRKVTLSENYTNSAIQQSYEICSCQMKREQNHAYTVSPYKGYLYPLEEELIFILPPSILIRLQDIEMIEFSHHRIDGLETNDLFDLFIKVHPDITGSSSVLADGIHEYVFSEIDKSHISKLKEYFFGKSSGCRSSTEFTSRENKPFTITCKDLENDILNTTIVRHNIDPPDSTCIVPKKSKTNTGSMLDCFNLDLGAMEGRIGQRNEENFRNHPNNRLIAPSSMRKQDSVTEQTHTHRKSFGVNRKRSRESTQLVDNGKLNLNVLSTAKLDSLGNILSNHDANFLGDKLWIFTVQQLSIIINDDLPHTDSEIAVRRGVAKEEFESAVIREFGGPAEVSDVLGRWRQAIKDWDQLKAHTAAPSSTFPFSGPVACLMSPFLINFLSTNNIHNVYDFNAIKKTESSIFVKALNEWRNQNGFKSKVVYCVKALTSVEDRIMHALYSIPNLDSKTRSWMGGSLLSLPKSVHDFVLSHCEIYMDEQFLSTSNSILTQKLLEWRKLKNFEPLKGNGAQSMISTWIGLVKETRFANSIQFLPDERELASKTKMLQDKHPTISENAVSNSPYAECCTTSLLATLVPEEKSHQQENLKQAIPHCPSACTSDSKSNPNLPQDEFVINCSIDGLSESARDFLGNKMRITTSRELISYNTTELADEYARWRQEQNKPPLKGKGAYNTVYGWKNVLKVNSVKRRRSDSNSNSNTDDRPDDSLFCFSGYVRDFLRNRMQITTAQELLEYKSYDLAVQYDRWRQEQNKPPLKGKGAYTTICGWKSAVQEKCHKRRRSDSSSDSGLLDDSSSSPEIELMNTSLFDGNDLLMNMNLLPAVPTRLIGLPCIRLAFGSTISAQIDCVFYFTLWALPHGDRSEFFMTYTGARAYVSSNDDFDDEMIYAQNSATACVLKNLTIEKETHLNKNKKLRQYDLFRPYRCNCGHLDVTRFNLFDGRKDFDDDLRELKSMIHDYLDGPQALNRPKRDSGSRDHSSLVLSSEIASTDKDNHDSIVYRLRDSQGFERHILRYKSIVERGQTVRLVLDNKEKSPPSLPLSVSSISTSIKQLATLGLRISTLSISHIEAMTSHLHNDFKSLDSRLDDAFMMLRSGKFNKFEHQEFFKELLSMCRQRRRFHAVCEKLLIQCKNLSAQCPSSIGMDAIDRAVCLLTSMSWNNIILRHGHSLRSLNDSLVLNELHDDTKNEVAASCIEIGRIPMVTAESDVSSNLYHCIMTDVSHHLLFNTSDDIISQKYLSEVIHGRAVAASKMLFDVCDNLSSIRKISFLAQDNTMTESTPIVVMKQTRSNTQQTASSSSLFSPGDEHYQAVDSITSLDNIVVHKNWYLVNHILFPIYCICSSGLMPWIWDEDLMGKHPLQSLGGLYQAILKSMETTGSGSNQCLYINDYNVLQLITPEPNSEIVAAVTRWTHVFFRIVWPSLVRHGWVIHPGSTVDELLFVSYRKLCSPPISSVVNKLTPRDMVLPRRLYNILQNSLVVSLSGESVCLRPYPCSVKYALEKYASLLSEKLSMSKSLLILEVFLKLFDDMAFHLLFQHERLSIPPQAKADKLHDACACDILLRLLIVLPETMKSSCLDLDTEQSIHSFVAGLIDFLSQHDTVFFPESLLLSDEDDISFNNYSTQPLASLVTIDRDDAMPMLKNDKMPFCEKKLHSLEIDEFNQSADYSDYNSVTISRLALSKLCTDPFFEKAICNLFVRVNAGRDSLTNGPKYILGRINGVEVVKSEAYEFLADPGKPPVTTHQYLSLSIGHELLLIGMNLVSDSPPLDHEIEEYIYCMNQHGFPLLRKEEIFSMRETKISTWHDSLQYDGNIGEKAFASLSLYKTMAISRKKLIDLCSWPFFEKAVLDFYVQVSASRGEKSASQTPFCRFCRIVGIEEKEKDYYEIEMVGQEESTVITNKYLLLDDGAATCLTSMDLVLSCESCLEDNIRSYVNELTISHCFSRLMKKDEAFYLLQGHEKFSGMMSSPFTEKDLWNEPDTCANMISVSSTDVSESLDVLSPMQAAPIQVNDTIEASVKQFTQTIAQSDPESNCGQFVDKNAKDTTKYADTYKNKEVVDSSRKNDTSNAKDTDAEVEDHYEKGEIESSSKYKDTQATCPPSMIDCHEETVVSEKYSISFSNYTDLLTYISSSPEWMSKPDVACQIQKYNLELVRQGYTEVLQRYRQPATILRMK